MVTKNIIDALKMHGHDNVEISQFENAHHSFDRKDTVLQVVDHGYSLVDCRLSLSKNGIVRSRDYGFPLSNSMLQKLWFYFRADRGPTIGGNDEARIKAMRIAKGFMRTILLH